MLLEPDGSPAWRSEDVLREIPPELAEHTRGETHGLALEIATNPHATVAEATEELRRMRAGLAETVWGLGLRAAVAGTHPHRARRGGRGLPRRPLPVPAPQPARARPARADVRAARARRGPGRRARRARVQRACARTSRCCSRSPRTRRSCAATTAGSPPRARRSSRPSRAPASRARSKSYAEYVEAIDVLIRCGAIPEPTFIWWDVRLQPKLGTLEVRVMDAQTRIRDTAALAALVQCLVRLEALDGMAEPELCFAPEVLDENRFLAARDGIDAQLLDPHRDRCVPASGRLATLVDACWPHARALHCERELRAARPPGGRPRRDAPARDRLRARGPSRASCTPCRRSSRRRARS